jgi:primosomal protein N' (replication factor Y)
MERKTFFVDVLLPLHVRGCFTYRVPADYNDVICVGQRVVVQFGRTKLYSALVRRVHEQVPAYKTKYILAILNVSPILNEQQFLFWEWMASYYMCYEGDVMSVALPSAYRLSSESYILPHPDFDGDIDNLDENEIKVLQALQVKGHLPVEQVASITGFAKIMPLLQTMIEKHIIILQEELQERYIPRSVPFLSLEQKYMEAATQRALFEQLEKDSRTHKQLSVLIKFMQLSHFGRERIAKKQLTDCTELSASAIQTLIKNGVLLQETQTISRLIEGDATASADDIVLNEEQQAAYEYLRDTLPLKQTDEKNTADAIKHKTVNLLHGVTSSGKTEIYIKLISDVLKRGQQALFLLPEIALTAQIINRLRRYFGPQVGIYHSRFNFNERAEVWAKTMTRGPEGYKVLIGARSALFLPFYDLGLVIVDEEHDSSYKQAEPAPRYQGRDSAIYLAHLYGATTVLGSATPSIESMSNARNGKYGLATLSQRYGGLQMPLVECVDMRAATSQKLVKLNLSSQLIEAINDALTAHEQVILFQNRRGFSLHLECSECHWIPTCENCDVSLVYHKATNSLRCHYCGYSIPVPSECPVCHSQSITMKGFGTEHIEEDLGILFPTAKVERMDLDSTSQKNRYAEIIGNFEDHQIDILVGTQMVTKGLDFDRVSVVGILSADSIIGFPDFRSYERAYQLMTQVAGRAGRHGKRGRVIIQSFHPEHPVINDAIKGDYDHMYASQINDRRIFRYPPYYRLVQMTLRHREAGVINAAANWLANKLRTTFGNRVLGPNHPIVTRVRGQYLMQIIVRFDKTEGVSAGKNIIMQTVEQMKQEADFKSVTVIFDVDPQ